MATEKTFTDRRPNPPLDPIPGQRHDVERIGGGQTTTMAISNSGNVCRTIAASRNGLVIEWATLRQQELLADWDRARELQKIAPLE